MLDEVGELSPAVQPKVLRALQDGEIQPVGSTVPRTVDLRVVASTHRDLSAEVEAGRFREDLFYRLAVVELWVPPLRERPEDIPLLAEALRRRHAQRMGLDDLPLPRALLEAMTGHAWPGNVRELENAIVSLLAFSARGEIDTTDWRTPTRDASPPMGWRPSCSITSVEFSKPRSALLTATGPKPRVA